VNVLLIVCDTLRADHVGCYGYFRETTPNIDRVAAEGVLLEDFYNSGAPTGPGFTCIYTGLHSIHHRFYLFLPPNIRPIDDTIFTLPEIMRARGYTTAALDNLINFPAHSKHFVRGYEFYINASPGAFASPPVITAEQVNRRLLPWIRDHSDERFFLFVHYWDPHLPYNQPKEYQNLFHHERGSLSDLEVREAPAGYKYVPGWGRVDEINEGGADRSIDLYDGEVAYMDHAIGETLDVLEEAGILEETLIIVTSDHGEQLGQHGAWGHNALHDSVTHIPLILRYPKRLPRGRRVRGFGQHIDLLPTILDLTGGPPRLPNIDGRSLTPLLMGKPLRERVFMEHVGLQRAVRTEEWKFIEYVRGKAAPGRSMTPERPVQLYNVRDDPMEAINLAEKEKKQRRVLQEALDGWVRSNLREGEEDPILSYTPEERARMHAREYHTEGYEKMRAQQLTRLLQA